jgi:hypothetical protein
MGFLDGAERAVAVRAFASRPNGLFVICVPFIVALIREKADPKRVRSQFTIAAITSKEVHANENPTFLIEAPKNIFYDEGIFTQSRTRVGRAVRVVFEARQLAGGSVNPQ